MGKTVMQEICESYSVLTHLDKGDRTYCIKNGTLLKVTELPFIDSHLVVYDHCVKWVRGGVAFGQFFYDVQWISDEYAKIVENQIRKRAKEQRQNRR